MKHLLSVLRILIGVFLGIFVILTILFAIFSFTYEPKIIQNSTGLIPDLSKLHITLTMLGMFWSAIITLFFIILYFIIKKFF